MDMTQPARIIKNSLSNEFRCMPIVEPEFAASQHDPRLGAQLADLATGAAPAWLWSADGSQMLWANAVGAAIFGAAHAHDGRRAADRIRHPAAGEIVRLAATLPPTGQPRLERLRGFAAVSAAPSHACARASRWRRGRHPRCGTEPAGPPLPLTNG